MMRVLAVDTAVVTGIAHDGDAPYVPVLASFRLPAEADDSLRCHVLAQQLRRLVAAVKPALIVFESPMPYGGKGHETRWASLRKGAEYGAIVQLVAGDHGIECLEEAPQTVRKHFVEHGRPRNAKFAVMARCQELGWQPPDHNAADAAALWHYAKCLIDPVFAATVTRLMTRAAA
jgi:hypothetical protein